MASQSHTTKDHEEIKRWAEERGGKPAHVTKTESSDDIGILRLEFPGATGANDSNLEAISWDQFFEKFDERGLALLYQEETAGGEKSNFNKLVSSETADESGSSSRAKSSKRSSKSAKSAARPQPVAKKAAKKAAAKNTAVKKPAAKTVTKKAAAKKTATKKATTKKSVAKKVARSTARFPTKKTAANVARKGSGKKVAAKRAPAKKTSGRRGR